jgi:hypothetical protein
VVHVTSPSGGQRAIELSFNAGPLIALYRFPSV